MAPPALPEIQRVTAEIDTLIRARYPILYLLSHEESRIEALMLTLAAKQGKALFSWTATAGLAQVSANGAPPMRVQGDFNSPNEVLQNIQTRTGPGLFLLKDFHPFLDDPQVVRRLRDLAHELKGTYKNILIVSPRLNLPVELEKEISIIDIPLPDFDELMELFRSVCRAVGQSKQAKVQLTVDDAKLIVRAAQGLSLLEAENVFSKAVVDDSLVDKNDISTVLKEKQQIIRKSGILEFFPAENNLAEVGGLSAVKKWLSVRGRAFGNTAANFGLATPKGVLLLGAPGCGKSLTAKAVANAWRMPLVRLDLGRIFSGLVGSSEENMRRALKVAEGVAPAVLWLDEIEKGLAGHASGSSDSGTAARVFGTFLTWMQEKTAKVFVVATANRIDALPPELLRRGRFDEIFFMDLPVPGARAEILAIHLRKRKRDPQKFDVAKVSAATEGFSGAEIEHCLSEALFTAFSENREVTTEDLLKAAAETIPLSVTYAEDLRRLREWAKDRARSADAVDTKAAASPNRASRLEVKKSA